MNNGNEREPTGTEAAAEMLELVSITMTRMQWWAVCGALAHVLNFPDSAPANPAPDVALKMFPEIIVGIETKTGLDEAVRKFCMDATRRNHDD